VFFVVKRVGIVKPEIVDKVQNSILQAAQSGQLQGRVDEDQVKGMLAKAGADKAASGKVVVRVFALWCRECEFNRL